MPWFLEQIKSCTYRQFTTGFFYGKPSEETQIYDNNTYEKGYTYLGIVGPKNEKGMYRVEQKNKFSVGEQIEVMKPDGRNVTVTVRGLMDEKGEPMESCPHPQQIFYVDLGMEPDEYDILGDGKKKRSPWIKKILRNTLCLNNCESTEGVLI